ncbi:uncharacterized protein LOC123678807 [Harmonia axyridis]|uniref:uncharacterized protein LOC123678807 n=1 Tax=Harmonia axyridis TaxID=115357 RepID=UPI001E277FBA|nr:uncharacterized protein LOC123678807 [Harmonia axyridis]XP_045471993.1 uncharacterized protein LOC123678807 [Harmonia axyridis]
MVNGNVDKNSTCSNLKPDEENVHQQTEPKNVSSPIKEPTASSLRKSSNSPVSCETEKDNADAGGEEIGPREMAESPTKPTTSLFCSVPLTKFRSVLSSAGGKNDDEENSSKLKQVSRKLLCLYCDRTFVSSNLRQKHVERCHSEKQSRRLSSRKLQSQFTTTACFHCDKLPVEHSLRQLFEHLISAHPQKYFGCLLCEERFLTKLQLNDHNTKLHDLSQKDLQNSHPGKVSKGSENSDEAKKTSTGINEEKKDKEQKTSVNPDKKKKTIKSKTPPRQLRNKKKVSIKASKVGSKRSKRLQSAQNKVPSKKKKTKTVTPKSEESTSKTTDRVKTTPVNPYPEFDYYYRVKKITDHSIDNLKISSLTFDDVFDKAFFNRIKCNIQENLLYHLDGKLFKNEESESRISNFEKNPPSQEVASTTSENFGCDLSLNAVTPVTSILASNFGEDLESQIEYGSKPSKKKLQVRQDPVRHKYVTRRKYQASILEHKENRDLSKLDMWTQLVIKDRQQKVLNGQKSAKEILEYTICAEYKLEVQRNELNRILDRRGPFEDLKEEASKKAALEQLNSESYNEISEECFKEVRFLMEDLLMKVVENCTTDEVEPVNKVELGEKAEFLEKEDIPELPDYLKLRRTSSLPSEEEIDKSDKIALICSSQETENYELPTNTVRDKDEMIELSGEWARSRIYVCAACGLKVPNMKLLIDHKSLYHPNSWVQHYELVGNQSELYRHLCIPGLGKVGYVEETVPCKSWLKSESRVCTKCGKVCNSLSELHRHILECGGDWTWMLARKKCKYRPFGARKKRRGLVKRIRVSNQKTDQTEKKKYKKTFEGPRQRPSDAETIQRMLANLPPKRSSRKSICMKDGFPRNRQKSPKNKKQVMKCGKIVRHKSTYDGNVETTKNPSNLKKASVRQTLRSISRTLSSKILDTNSKLKAKRQLIQKINRRSPRKNSQNISAATDEVITNEEGESNSQINIKKTSSNIKNEGHLSKIKTVLKEKVNMKNFFPVSKRKTTKNTIKKTEISNSDSGQPEQSAVENNASRKTSNKPTKNVMKSIKNSLNPNKKTKANSKNDANIGGNSEPIVVIEKLPQIEQTEKKPLPTQSAKKTSNKRKLRSSFRKVIDKVKKLKLDNTTSLTPSERNEVGIKHVNSFLGQGAREREKLATVLVPLVEETKESPPSNLAFVQNAMDNNSPTEESLIPENIFNFQHNSEDLLQAKSPLESLTDDVKRHDKRKCFSVMSAKVKNIPESDEDHKITSDRVETKSDIIKPAISNNTPATPDSHEAFDKKSMSLLSIETSVKSDKSPLISPVLSPSMLSPRMKGKIRKPNRGLNDCIAMLTKKAFEETHKTEIVPESVKSVEKPCLDNKNEAHKIIRANECILKIPIIEVNTQLQSEVLDLSKPKRNLETHDLTPRKAVDLPSPKPTLWNPVNDILCNNPTINDSKITLPTSSTKIQNTIVSPSIAKAILKIPKFVEVSRGNNVDNIIQGVIENYDEPLIKTETIKPYLKVPSVGLLNSVDKVIEEVVKGNFENSSIKEIFMEKMESPVDKKDVLEGNNTLAVHKTPKFKKAKKRAEESNSLKDDVTSISSANETPSLKEDSELDKSTHIEVDKVDSPQIISTPHDSTLSEPVQEHIGSNKLNATAEETLAEKPINDVESNLNDRPDEIAVPDSSVIADIVTVSESSKKKASKKGKKIGEVRKRTAKKSPNKFNKMKEQDSNVEEPNMKVVADNQLPILLQTNEPDMKVVADNQLPILLQTNEPDILEEKKIHISDEKPASFSTNTSISLPTNNSCVISIPELISMGEVSKLHEEENKLMNDLKENSEKSLECNENVNVSVDVCISTPENENVPKAVDEISAENDFKTSSTDSEDELPLLVLKNRNKVDLSKKIPAVVEETEKELSIENETNEVELPKCNEENTEDSQKDIIEPEKMIENVLPLNELIIEEPPFPIENGNLPESDKSLNKEGSEVTPPIIENKRKSSRKTVIPNIRKQENKSKNKSKNSSKPTVIKKLEETSERENILENISNTIEPKKHQEVCWQDSSENEVQENASIEANSSPSNLDTVVVDSFKKPKNFLVDTSISNFNNDKKNSTVFPLKSSKTKKKDKIKHDSVKEKLIFKFPKIILKEPILRIPPRGNTIETTTSFGSKPDNSQEKGVKLILDNPFLNIKEREDKISSISNISDILGKSIENNIIPKLRISNKKKISKHKKKSFKLLKKVQNNSEVVLEQNQDGSSENIKISPVLNLPIEKGNTSVEEHFESLLDDSNIPVSTESPNISHDELKNKTEITPNQPITIKLQTNPTKRSGSKKKRDKVKKFSLSSQLDDRFFQNNCSNLEETNIFKELSSTQIVENIGICDEVSSKDEEAKECKFDYQANELEDTLKSGSEIQHETISKSQLVQGKTSAEQTSSLEISHMSLTGNIPVESKDCVPPRSGRSLRSTVKITYKQSNIFALQIEDKEISDLRITEKPKSENENVVFNELPSIELKSQVEDVNTTNHKQEESAPEALSVQGSSKEDLKTTCVKSTTNKKGKTDFQPVDSPNHYPKQTISSESIINIKQSNQSDVHQLSEDYSQLELLKPKEPEKEMKKPTENSKKNRKSSRTKKVSDEVININSTEGTETAEIIRNPEEKNADESVQTSITTNKILEENSGESLDDNILLQENITKKVFALDSMITVETHEPIENISSSAKYEDSSFSEGELVINESFENQESTIFEEPTKTENNSEIVVAEIDTLLQGNELINGDNSENTISQKKTQKSKRHKKSRSSKSPKKYYPEDHSMKTSESADLNELLSVGKNDIVLNEESKNKKELSLNIIKTQIDGLQPINFTDYNYGNPPNVKPAQKKTDEFEFEEDILSLSNLSSHYKEKNKEIKCKDLVMESVSLNEAKLENVSSVFLPNDFNKERFSLDSNITRRQRSAKSKALENINIIEKKLDEILQIELSPNHKIFDEKNDVPLKSKKKCVSNSLGNDVKESIGKETSMKDGKPYNTIDDNSQRKSRAAKSRAIENMKILETKVNDIEEIPRRNEKLYCNDEMDKLKNISKPKERNTSPVKGNNKHLLKNHVTTTTNHETKFAEEKPKEESKTEVNKISSLSCELSSTLLETNFLVAERSGEKDNIEVNNTYKNVDIHNINDKVKEKGKNTRINLILQESKMKELEEKDSFLKINQKGDTSTIKKNKFTKSKVKNNITIEKEKEVSVKKDNLESHCQMEDITKSKSEIESDALINLFSFGTPLDMNQIQKSGDSEIKETNNKKDCYDIATIDEDHNLCSEGSISLSPTKKKKKPIRNETKLNIVDIEEKRLKAYTEEKSTIKSWCVKDKTLDHNHDVSLRTDANETEEIDSLDITLKTTVDEISSILMENNHEMINSFTNRTFEETSLHKIMQNDSRKNSNDERHWSVEQKSFDKHSDKKKRKRNRDSSSENPVIGKEKLWNIEIGAKFETESKRRSRRACKVNTYNENDLVEAIFEQVAPEKEKMKKKKTEESLPDSSNPNNILNIPSSEVSTKKLNSDELFDLLKATAPDNLIALKPVEENPSDTLITDDNFDDEFDDILRKSQALFGEKTYKKLDDICRSDDSSNTSKSTGFYKSDENTTSNNLIEKSTESYFGEHTFNNSISSVSKNENTKSEEASTLQLDDLYCDICKKSFKRIDNLIKHRTTLTHIAKLSEMEAKEAEKKSRAEIVNSSEELFCTNVDLIASKKPTNSSYSFPTNTRNNALKIAEIITEALEKPASQTDRNFSEIITPLPEYRRYKSLGERKSFEYDSSPNIGENIDVNSYEPKISNNTGVILKEQITLLQNIVGIDCANDASTSSFHSLGNSIGRDSPVSIISSKLEDSTNLVFPNEMDSDRRSKVGGFLKPPQIEDISEDSAHLKNSEDVKSRKVLNRDEELFLECCSLLKSGSEVSNFSKKSNRNSFFNNVSTKILEEPDVLESKNVIYKVTEDSCDYSRRATPLGDSFGDTSNSNTISSSWGTIKNEQLNKNQENFFNFSQTEKYSGDDGCCSNSSESKNLASIDAEKTISKQNTNSNLAASMSRKVVKIPNKSSSNMPTKGAFKKFRGLKISLPTSKLNMSILRKKLLAKKSENNSSDKFPSVKKQFACVKTLRRKSKPVKNKLQIDDRFIFKVNKKPILKDTEENKSKSFKETTNDKITDVYDFEETQDNTDVFAKPDFKSFRAKGTEIVKGETAPENNLEAQTMSNSSSSTTLSGKKAKTNECITKKKHMIMGRIFKNAVKPKLDEEIRDIPAIDHNELVENYVKNCTPKNEEKEFKKPKMTEEEMNILFDKLLDKPAESPKKSCSTNKIDNKNIGIKKKLRMKCKKRQRTNSESTDDEFGLNRIVKRRPGRKNAKEEDNSINLEQELKECIGVASRKSQRKCTSGKQNVLVEYWSSDESAFETFLENHLQELTEKSDLPIPTVMPDKQENEKIPYVPKENPPKSSSICVKNKKPKSKPKVSSKKKESKELLSPTNEALETSVQSNRRKRTAAHPLYHWSSSSEDESQDLIEIKSIRDDPEDEYDEERPVQHGWIVGDSPKKLVTMLAQAKGKKTEPESLVKEQGKKKNSNS